MRSQHSRVTVLALGISNALITHGRAQKPVEEPQQALKKAVAEFSAIRPGEGRRNHAGRACAMVSARANGQADAIGSPRR